MKKIRTRIHYLYCLYLILFCSDGLAQGQSIRVTDLPNLIVEERLLNSNKSDLNLRQNDIQQKSPKNLAQSLEDELGMSNSSFGQGANRPIIRGMSGSRVPIMQNGMNSGDVSDLSADHAVVGDVLFNQHIEVLRGGEALRYSSSANQGLVNTIDNRIPASQLASPSASLISQYNFNQQGMTNGLLVEDSIGSLTLHVDNTTRSFNDYKRADGQLQPYSFSRQNDFGIGASYFRDSGFTGISFSQFQNFYGIPSQEGSQIDVLHHRFSLRDEQSQPLDGFTKLITQFNYSNYSHQEISTSSVAQSEFKNTSYDARFELFHLPFLGWKGSLGLQAGSNNISATDLTNPIVNAAIIPATKSDHLSLFALENQSFGIFDFQNALRYEWVKRNPNTSLDYAANPDFSIPSNGYAPTSIKPISNQFSLVSLSTEAAWNYSFGQNLHLRYTFSQRAPSVDELYSYGNHDSTATFDVGNPSLSKESSNHFELGWRKNQGVIQGKLNLYQNFVNNYVYTQYTGAIDLESNFPVRQFLQANATLKGVESELTYKLNSDGLSGRIFGDYSVGVLDQGGYLPLQPATRIGGAIFYNQFGWKSKLSLIHAFGHNKTASSPFYNEPKTEQYNKLDFSISKSQALSKVLLTYYLQANNLLNDTIRFSTTVDTLRLYAPQPGRALIVGIKVDY